MRRILHKERERQRERWTERQTNRQREREHIILKALSDIKCSVYGK